MKGRKTNRPMKLFFLDFDGVMDAAYYGHVYGKEGCLSNSDAFGAVFDPNCVRNPNKF